nr:hypothetical protein [Staphylococcus haemolyticus]
MKKSGLNCDVDYAKNRVLKASRELYGKTDGKSRSCDYSIIQNPMKVTPETM